MGSSGWEDALRAEMAAASPPAEAKGDRLMAQARRELTGFWSCLSPASATYSYAAGFFDEAAKAYRLAKNWRKAALAHHEYGTYRIKMGRDRRLAAAVALWESAECHMRDFDPDDEQTAGAIESDLKRSVRMLVLENQPQLAASACEELARMYVARRRWTEAREWYERAAGYYADTGEPYCIQLCRPRALQEAVSAAVRGAIAAMLGPVQMPS